MLIFLFHEVRMYGMTFEELHIIPPILKALREAGYRRPTPIQEAAIPPVLKDAFLALRDKESNA